METVTQAEAQERKAVFDRVRQVSQPQEATAARRACCAWLTSHPDDLGVITAVQQLVRIEYPPGGASHHR